MSVMVYKCPQCGAPLTFDADKRSWVCKFCLGTFEVEKLEKINADEKQNVTAADGTDTVQPESTTTAGRDDEFNRDARVYSCPDCGAEIVTDATTAATFCVFCHNPAIIQSQLSGNYRPAKVIPFKFDKEKAKETFKTWCRKKPLVPASFKSAPQLEKITGVYLPFWLFDCDVEGFMHANAQKIRTWRTGNYEYTETQYFEVFRQGNMFFRGMPVDGSSKMDNKMMELLEPYHYDQLIDFSMPYLSGYLAEKYDEDENAVFPRIEERVNGDTVCELKETVKGYSAVEVDQSNVLIRSKSAEYVLLPVWMQTYKYNGKDYLFAMNGQTGKAVGNLPYSFKRAAAWFGGIAAAVFAILFAGGMIL